LAPPFLGIELEDAEGAPVDRVELLVFDVAHRGYSEGEDVLLEFVLGVLHSVVVRVKLQAFVEVLSAKAAHDHDRVARELWGAEALASSHHEWIALWISELDFSPLASHVAEAETDFKALDGVWVALRLIWDTAKYVDHFSIEVAAGVVVATIVEHGDLLPLVGLNVVQLALLGRAVHILAGACHQNVSVTDRACWMTVAWILHPCLEHAVVSRSISVENELIGFIHWGRRQVEVTTADHEEQGLLADLHELEIVREVIGRVALGADLGVSIRWHVGDTELIELSILPIKHENILGVLVENVNVFWQLLSRALEGGHFGLALADSLVDLGFRGVFFFGNFSAALDVLEEGFVLELLLAARASKLQDLEDISYVSMQFDRLQAAWAVDALHWALACPLLLSLDAGLTVESIALWTLQREWLDDKLAEAAREQFYGVLQGALHVNVVTGGIHALYLFSFKLTYNS
jgi:hypothetical protein